MKNILIKSLSLSLLVVFFGVTGCEPPAEDADEASAEAEETAPQAVAEAAEEPIEVDSLPDEKERMSELLKMEKKAAETSVTPENAEEVAAQLEAEIAADRE